MARVDMHCHSMHSDRTARWYLQKINASESYTAPEDLHRRLKRAGMDYVTITDHDTITGALELADRHADAFVSCELTVRFPHDGAATHLCVYDITEEQFRTGRKLSADVRQVAAYFREQGVLVSVPHPLHGDEGRLEPAHLEQLVLLFENFEEVCGLQLPVANRMQADLLGRLTPELLEDLVRKHGIEPAFDRPWHKGRLGGSDAHAALHLGRAWTEVDGATSLSGFLRGVRERRSTAHGVGVDPTLFSHSVLGNVVQHLLRQVGQLEGSWRDRMTALAREVVGGAMTGEGELDRLAEAALSLWHPEAHQGEANADQLRDRTFDLVNRAFNTLVGQGLEQWVALLRRGRLVDAFGQLGLLAPATLLALPYLLGQRHLHSDGDFRRQVGATFGVPEPDADGQQKWAWFTDTITDINGVARTIQTVARLAERNGTPITAITCAAQAPDLGGRLRNFEPVFRFKLPEYELMSVSIPPLLEMLRYCQEQRFTRFVISTPGPVGLCALLIARLLGIRTAAIYHTDLPRYVGALTGVPALERLAWQLVRLLYGNVDQVYALAESSREELRRNGLAEKEIAIFPKGIDVELFNPGRRDPSVWRRWNLNGKTKIIYVGRVSREKGLDLLTAAFERVAAQRKNVELVVVGDGPYLEELRARRGRPDGVVFTGFVEGEELARMYASADIFAFPSTTDTYGSVVLEAQASGLAAVVTDVGGPKNVIVDGETGLVARGDSIDSFADTLLRLVDDDQTRRRMGREGRRHVEDRTWESALQLFWNEESGTQPTGEA
jgi:glycosyltransferase involved in cell wall biosynthesis